MDTTIEISRDIDTNKIVKVIVSNFPVFDRKVEGFAVFSPNFKLLGYSRESKEKAIKDFERSLDVFFQLHIVRNSLSDALRKLGWDVPNDEKKILKNKIPPHLMQAEKLNKTLNFA